MHAETSEQVDALAAMEAFAQAAWWQWWRSKDISNPGQWSTLRQRERKGWRRHARRAFVGVLAACLWRPVAPLAPRE